MRERKRQLPLSQLRFFLPFPSLLASIRLVGLATEDPAMLE